jgi:hypothetical protein
VFSFFYVKRVILIAFLVDVDAASLQAASSSSSSTSASAFPSMSDSDESGGGKRGLESSSLGTSVSGASEGEVGVRSVKGTSVFALQGDIRKMQAVEARRGRGTDVESQQQQHRTRTFSAPQAHSHFRNRSVGGGGGLGSSPLASSSTPWLAGTRGREAAGRRQFSRLAGGNAGLSSDGEPPSRSMSPSADEGSASSSIAPPPPPSQVRSADQRHPLSKSSPPLLHTASSSPPAGGGYAADGLVSSSFQQRTTTVDYKEPRRLHEDINSPTLLSTYEEPIWEVVQDMREQRMSLCQSLRQYVFVHAAVIEGALMIVDEERERDKIQAEVGVERRESPIARLNGNADQNNYFSIGAQATASQHPNFATPLPLILPPVAFTRPVAQMHSTASDESSVSVSSSTGKRGASPTELLKEGRKGEVLLSKRPSIKRKHLSETARAPAPFQGHAHNLQSQSLGLPGTNTVATSAVAPSVSSGSGPHVPLLSTVPSSPPVFP